MKINSLKKVYFLLATFFGLCGTVIALAIAINSLIMLNFISDGEYLEGNDYYAYQCEQPTIKTGTEPTQRTEQEIQDCIQKEEQKTLSKRAYDSKESIIGGFTRGILFLIVFVTHARIFFKQD